MGVTIKLDKTVVCRAKRQQLMATPDTDGSSDEEKKLGKRLQEDRTISGEPLRKSSVSGKLGTLWKMCQLEGSVNRSTPLKYIENGGKFDCLSDLGLHGGFLGFKHPKQHGRVAELICGLVQSNKLDTSVIFDGSGFPSRFSGHQRFWSVKVEATLVLYPFGLEEHIEDLFACKAPHLKILHVRKLKEYRELTFKQIAEADIVLVLSRSDGISPYMSVGYCGSEVHLSFPHSDEESELMKARNVVHLDNFHWKRVIFLRGVQISRNKLPISDFVWIVCGLKKPFNPFDRVFVQMAVSVLRASDTRPDYNWLPHRLDNLEILCDVSAFVRENLAILFDESTTANDDFQARDISELVANCDGASNGMQSDTLKIRNSDFHRILLSNALHQLRRSKTLVIETLHYSFKTIMGKLPDDQDLIKIPRWDEETVAHTIWDFMTNDCEECSCKAALIGLEDILVGYQYSGLSQIICLFKPTPRFFSKYMHFLGDNTNGFPAVWYLPSTHNAPWRETSPPGAECYT